MSWSNLRSRSRASALVAAVLATVPFAGIADAATMVVRSAGPAAAAYPPGKSLADTARIVLGPTDSLTLLDAKGTRTLKGPGTFTPLSAASASSTGAGSTLAALVSSGGEKRARIGAVRGATFGTSLRSPNLWYANVGSSATVCVANPGTVTMWRPGSAIAASSTIAGSGRTETIQWIAGQTARAWPATLPITDGATYTVGWPDGQSSTLRFAVVGVQAGAGGLQDMAGVLIKRGCQQQLDQLIDTAAAAPAPGAAG